MLISNYGPNLSEKYNNPSSLLTFMDSCTRYVSSLSPFRKFCVWRYTIGSGAVNSLLIFGKLSDNGIYWCTQFFKFYYNTYGGYNLVPKMFSRFKAFFNDPTLKLTSEQAFDFLSRYIETLQSIILSAPKVTNPFHVFKVSGKFPGLPETFPSSFIQTPFNSTTISPYFNFAPFISPTSAGYLFDVLMPKGSSCLYVPQEYHAYPFEMEIILPYNCVFNIKLIRKSILNYIDPNTINMKTVQDKNNIRMGIVFQINEYYPCKNNRCINQPKPFIVYDCTYQNP